MYKTTRALIVAILAAASPCMAQPVVTGRPNASEAIVRDTSPARVTGDSYIQLHVAMTSPVLPTDRASKKKFIGALVSALGGGKKTREITVNVRVKIGNVDVPERSIVTYRLDHGSNELSVTTDGNYTFPLKRLNALEKISVEVAFIDTTSAQYDVRGLSTSASKLVPGSSLVSDLTKPAIQEIAGLTGSVWNALSSQRTDLRYREELSPYGSGVKSVSIPLKSRDGKLFGVVVLSLQASDTLLQAPELLSRYNPSTVSRGVTEHPSLLFNEVAGTRVSFSSRVRALNAYTELVKDPTDTAIRNLCSAAREELTLLNGLSLVDSTYVVHGVLADAGLWRGEGAAVRFATCFGKSEIELLERVSSISSPVQVKAELQVDPSTISAAHLYAFGCWMLGSAGPDCAARSSNPEPILQSILAESVLLSVDSAFLSSPELLERIPISRATTISMLRATAVSFSCFKRGMLVRSRDGRLFRFEGRHSGTLIDQITIYPVAETVGKCTD